LQDRLARLFGYLELDRTPGFLLHDHRSRPDAPAQQHIVNPQRNEIAAAKLAVDSKVEHCEIAQALFQLKTNADRPDLPKLKRWFLPDEFAAVPGRSRFRKGWLWLTVGFGKHAWLLRLQAHDRRRPNGKLAIASKTALSGGKLFFNRNVPSASAQTWRDVVALR
jgi:hypothetical protein